jgi:hypothetical protein
MNPDPQTLVRLTECSSNIEASMLHAALEARGIYCFVQGENHRSLLGFLGPYVALNLMVKAEDLEVARAFLLERTEGEQAATPGPEERETRDAQHERSRNLARLLAVFPSFGSGHHRAGAHGRGLVFGAIQSYGIYLAATGKPLLGLGVAVLSIATDLVSVGAVIDQKR